MAERSRRNKVDCSFMAFCAKVLSLKGGLFPVVSPVEDVTVEWFDFFKVIGLLSCWLHASFNYECRLGLCKDQMTFSGKAIICQTGWCAISESWLFQRAGSFHMHHFKQNLFFCSKALCVFGAKKSQKQYNLTPTLSVVGIRSHARLLLGRLETIGLGAAAAAGTTLSTWRESGQTGGGPTFWPEYRAGRSWGGGSSGGIHPPHRARSQFFQNKNHFPMVKSGFWGHISH